MATTDSNRVTDDAIISTIKNAKPPALNAKAVANKLGVTRQAADNRLRQLNERGDLGTGMIGGARIYWIEDD